jgi:hypothetical protein
MTSWKARRSPLAALLALGSVAAGTAAAAQLMTKPQVADLIVKVEKGVDDFRDYLKRRGDNANSAAQTQTRRARGDGATDAQKATADARKDDLDNAMDELNRSTNRLRRKFDGTDTWMETKVQVEQMMDDARKINQVVAKGNYGSDAARLWGALRTGMNNLARAYGLQPLAV